MKVQTAALLVALAGVTTTNAFAPPASSTSRALSSSFLSTKASVPSPLSNKRGDKSVMVMMAQIPQVDNWRILKSGKLTGVVSNHPTYEDGETITTSTLADPNGGSDGVVVVTTSGSKYKLGAKYGGAAVKKSIFPKRNGKATPQTKVEAKKPAAGVTVAAKKIAAKKATAAPSKPTPAASNQPSLEKRLKDARKKYSLTGQSIGNGKYLLAGRPKRSTSGKSQIWTAYRADEEGLPTGDAVTVKLSPNIDAIAKENANYDLVTSGLFAGRFVNKIEFFPQAGELKGRMADQCALVIENGDLDLKAYLASRNKKGLTGRDMRDAAAAAAQCVQAMHSSNMVWTDLKTENFVVQSQGGSLTVKGIDLESARKMKGNPVDYSPEACPPEFANAFIQGNGPSFVLEPSYDMWSLGMMLYELSVGKPYFDGKSPIQITKQLRFEDFEADVSAVKDDKLRDLIGQCLKSNPKERPSITAFLLHPYFLTTGIGPFSF